MHRPGHEHCEAVLASVRREGLQEMIWARNVLSEVVQGRDPSHAARRAVERLDAVVARWSQDG